MTASLVICTIEVIRIKSFIGFASHFRQTEFLYISIRSTRSSSFTASTPSTVNQHLRGSSPLRKFILLHYIQPITYNNRSPLSPTRTTIIGYQLIYIPRHIIFPIHISPIPIFRQIRGFYIILRKWRFNRFSIILIIFRNIPIIVYF